MSIKPTKENFTVFADQCVATLPDSLSKRKACLECLLVSLPNGHPRKHEIAVIYAHLTAHERSQQEFSFGGAA